jgi:homocysteine S-methyltransferase
MDRAFLDRHELVLMEAAINERLRRDSDVELHPLLVNAALLCDEAGRGALRRIYLDYIEVARRAGLPLLLCTPTWRANRERLETAGVDADLNQDAVCFLKEMAKESDGPEAPSIYVGGLIGCKNDCYRPEEGLTPDEAEKFHAWQLEALARAGADFLIVETLPSVGEAVGVARAMAATGLPFVISFVIGRDGQVLDGTSLVDAVRTVEEAVTTRPLGFMVNCAHPSFLCASAQPPELFERLIGFQANASSLDHSELDGSSQLQADDIPSWGEEMLALHRRYGVKILGGCCGTGVEHLQYLADCR